MSSRTGLCVVVVAMMLHGAAPSAPSAQEPKKDAELSLNEVGLEINAYQMLRQFEFSFAQMEQLQKWAKETAQKDRPRDNKTSKEFAEKLREVHKAYVANDDERVDQLTDDLEQLRESEKPALDDGVDITAAARKRAAEAFRSLKPRQLAAYLGKVGNDVADPFDRLQAAFDEVRPLKGAEWRNKRDEIADELSRLVAGLDSDKADKVNDQVVALLIRAHDLSDADFQKERAGLDAVAREIVGNVNAQDVLRNQTELSLAELLSNPRLHATLSVRLK